MIQLCSNCAQSCWVPPPPARHSEGDWGDASLHCDFGFRINHKSVVFNCADIIFNGTGLISKHEDVVFGAQHLHSEFSLGLLLQISVSKLSQTIRSQLHSDHFRSNFPRPKFVFPLPSLCEFRPQNGLDQLDFNFLTLLLTYIKFYEYTATFVLLKKWQSWNGSGDSDLFLLVLEDALSPSRVSIRVRSIYMIVSVK